MLLGHAYELAPKPGEPGPIRRYFGWTQSAHPAVLAFFLISGILISQSFERSTAQKFTAMRFARIWPGLAACTLVSVALIGPLFTRLSALAYFTDRSTWRYFFENISLLRVTYFLPGVFANNHYPRAVNGSLWTIPVEVEMYMVVLIAGVCGFLRSGRRLAVVATAVIAASFLPARIPLQFNGSVEARSPALFFLIGMFAYRFRENIRLEWRLLAAAAGVLAAAWRSFIAVYIFYAAFAYAILFLAGWAPLRRLRPKLDISYGVYIYGFLIQQAAAQLRPADGPLQNLLICIPAALAIGALSWHTVEKPALDFARSRLDTKTSRTKESLSNSIAW